MDGNVWPDRTLLRRPSPRLSGKKVVLAPNRVCRKSAAEHPRRAWRYRCALKGQTCVLWSPVTLPAIAPLARRDHIFPGCRAAVRTWNDMVERQQVCRQLLTTILTPEVIAQQDTSPRA